MNPFIIQESQARYQARLDAAAAWRLEQTARAASIEDKRGGTPMIIHRSIRRVVTSLILTALIALAFWLPFRTGPSIARTVDSEAFRGQSSAIQWLPFCQPSQVAGTPWLPFRSGSEPGA